jgi:hypothetical protein
MGLNAFAIGADTVASGDNSFAQGIRATASGGVSFAEGYDTQSTAFAAHAEGNTSVASGESSHAEGGSTSSGFYAHAEGLATAASGEAGHSEGNRTVASGEAAHAEGFGTTASGLYAHAEGIETTASGEGTHAEGIITTASGLTAHAEGWSTSASGFASHAEGFFTSDNSLNGVHIMGSRGNADTPFSWFLGNGGVFSPPSLAAKILYNGNAYIDVAWHGGGADYAEMYETESGTAIEPGYFVTFAGAGEKIRLAQAYDEYVLGVTSRTPGFVAGAGELRWKNKYKLDEWGGIVYEDAAVPDLTDKQGNVIVPAHVERQPVLDPTFDLSRTYVPREDRPEWVKVALLGAVRVRDDGSLIPGGYCAPGMGGIATAAHTGYRVLRRTGQNQALILFR